MGRSFYTDEDETYSTPGLPTVAQDLHPKSELTELSTINKFGNAITTAPGLQSFVSRIRETTLQYYEAFDEKFEFYTDTAKAHFGMTTDRIWSFKDENENLLPDSITVLTSTLIGSIVARNHSLPIRFITPLLFGSIALKFTLPKTSDNISEGFGKIGLALESKYFPDFKDVRHNACNQIEETIKNTQNLKNDAWNGLVKTVHDSRESISSSIDSLKKD